MLTGAEAALVVNNCAAATFLVISALCRRREVIVSRGELVEIGGSFRMPDVMKSSGAKMVEIGTTNKTHLADYESAITDKTAAILKVHTSNYRIMGFTSAVSIEDSVKLAHSHDLPLLYDMGSGVVEDLQQWGYPHEPLAQEMGASLAQFSIAWCLQNPHVSSVITGASRVDQVSENMPAA